jgi:hypothetical protein
VRSDAVVSSFLFVYFLEVNFAYRLPTVEDLPYVGSPGAQRHRAADVCITDVEEVILKGDLSLTFNLLNNIFL